jgi:hypothetical protein
MIRLLEALLILLASALASMSDAAFILSKRCRPRLAKVIPLRPQLEARRGR